MSRAGRPPVWLLALVIGLGGLDGAAPAHADDADPWLGADKALHFAASASIAAAGYAGAALVTESRPARVATGGTLAIGAGVAKELWDATGHGDPSWRDLTWDVAGTVTGLLVAGAVDWIIGRLVTPAGAHR